MTRIRKSGESSGSDIPPNLAVSRVEAESKIASRIEHGTGLLAVPIQSEDDLQKARAEYTKWDQFNAELLRRLLTSSAISEEYTKFHGGVFSRNPSLSEKVDYYREDVQDKITRLESIKERLSLFEESQQASVMEREQPVATVGNKVFIVHGRDEGIKQAAARLLEKLGIEPVILHEQPSQGRTLIEKFENYSSVSYAVVILTPDDVGGRATKKSNLSVRARQNVVFELGYFIGKVGRKRVCALYKERVELPSDFRGVVYIPLDQAEAWKLRLAKELKAAGFEIDLNKAV